MILLRRNVYMSKLYSLYESLKRKDKQTIYLFKSGIFYLALSDDAVYLSNKFNFKLTNLNNSIVKCGFPISSIDKYINKFTSNNINFKLVDSTTNIIYSPKDYQLDCNVKKIIDSIISIDTNTLSVSEAYAFIENLQEEIKKINLYEEFNIEKKR